MSFIMLHVCNVYTESFTSDNEPDETENTNQ